MEIAKQDRQHPDKKQREDYVWIELVRPEKVTQQSRVVVGD